MGVGGWVGGWLRIKLIIRLSQPQAGAWAWAELGNNLNKKKPYIKLFLLPWNFKKYFEQMLRQNFSLNNILIMHKRDQFTQSHFFHECKHFPNNEIKLTKR